MKLWILILAGMAGQTAARAESLGPKADAALARYLAATQQNRDWELEAVDIQASIPKLAKQGRLRAIRRLLPFGRPEYQVLEIGGDQTVKKQVIARYLSADVQAAEMPPQSVAITPANYRFRYRGAAEEGGSQAYIFEITPHKKRAGLLKGQLWIDAASGEAVRLMGYLVRSPSVFVRRVNITRETCWYGGTAYMRVTHMGIDTRLIGRAELTITEWPYSASPAGNTAVETSEGLETH